MARAGNSHRPTGAAPAATSAAPVPREQALDPAPGHPLARLAALQGDLEQQRKGLAASFAAAGTTLAMIERSLADIDRDLMDVAEAQRLLPKEPGHEH